MSERKQLFFQDYFLNWHNLISSKTFIQDYSKVVQFSARGHRTAWGGFWEGPEPAKNDAKTANVEPLLDQSDLEINNSESSLTLFLEHKEVANNPKNLLSIGPAWTVGGEEVSCLDQPALPLG